MTLTVSLGLVIGIVALVAGIIILLWPRVLAYAIAIYLIVIGVLGIINALA